MSATGQRVGGLYVSLRGDTDEFERDMTRARREMNRTEGSANSLAGATHSLEGAFEVAAVAAAGLAIGLGALGMRFGPIEQQFARIEQNSEATAAQMDEMRDVAMQLGADLPTNMQDSANALYELTTAGLSASEATNALSGTTYLAVAGQLQMAEAAKVTTTVLNAWELQASQANAVADSLAATAAASATEVRDMGDAFTYASSTAAELGVSSQELSSFIGVLSDAGMEASIAGTSINQALLSLVNPTGQASAALQELGLSVSDLETRSGELKNVADIALMLRERLQGMSEIERARILQQIFGIRGARAMGPLIRRVEEFRDLMVESSQAEVLGGIERLGELDQGELRARQQEIGFALRPGSVRSVLEQFRRRARQEGLTQEELTAEIAVALNIEEDAARLLAGDLVGDTDMGALVQGIETANTAAKQAEASMNTFAGQVEQLIGSMDTFFFSVYEGVGFALMPLLMVLNPIADVLAENEWLGRAFGVTLVGLTAAAFVAAGALGVMAAEAWLTNAALVRNIQATSTYAFLSSGVLAPSQIIAAASSITLSGALATAQGALYGAAGAVSALWAALGPIGWIVLILIGLFAAWKTGLLDFIGLGGEADAVIGAIMWTLGGLADVLGGLLGIVGDVTGGLFELAGVLLRIATLPIVIPIKLAGIALRYLGDAVGGMLSPIEMLDNFIRDITGGLDLLTAILMGIPGIGVIVWLYKVAEHFGLIDDTVSSVTAVFRTFGYVIGFVAGVVGGLLSPAMDAAGDAANWFGEQVDAIGSSFDHALDRAMAFFDYIDPRGEGQSWGDWINPMADQQRGGRGNAPQQQRNVGREAGRATTEGFSAGARDGEQAVKGAMSQLADLISGFLPSSDARMGPLSNLTQQGAALPQTFARGAQQNASIVMNAGRTIADMALRGLPFLPGAQRRRPRQAGGVGQQGTNVSVEGGGAQVRQTGGGTTVSYSPTFNVDIGGGTGLDDLDGIDRRIRAVADRSIRQLMNQIETQMHDFETGQ